MSSSILKKRYGQGRQRDLGGGRAAVLVRRAREAQVLPSLFLKLGSLFLKLGGLFLCLSRYAGSRYCCICIQNQDVSKTGECHSKCLESMHWNAERDLGCEIPQTLIQRIAHQVGPAGGHQAVHGIPEVFQVMVGVE